MVLTTEILVAAEGWTLEKIFHDGTFSHYVLDHELANGQQTTLFDEVNASGGLLHLSRDGSVSVSFNNVIDGSNEYAEADADMPRDVFEALREIGPY